MQQPTDRETIADATNPLGLDGIEFIEFSTSRPQALGQVLETMGFRPIARHRSREVLLYRQGDMNLIVNAHAGGLPRSVAPDETPVIAALALRVRDASAAFRHVVQRGAWAVPTQVEVMELNIPAIHGAGSSRIYFVDRHKDFSIYDVDFTLIPTVDPKPPALTGLHWFGIVQYIGRGRTEDWVEFYGALFGFRELPQAQRYGILPKGRILQSPAFDAAGSFFLQLIEPDAGTGDAQADESLHRIGLGTPNVPASVQVLRERGVSFVASQDAQSEVRGALTQTYLGSVMFELVHDASSGRG